MSTQIRLTTTARRFPTAARRVALAGAAVLLAGLVTTGCGSGSDAHDIGDKAAIQAKMDRLVSLGVPGIAVLVRDGDRSLQLTSGLSDLKRKTAVAADDHFRTGTSGRRSSS